MKNDPKKRAEYQRRYRAEHELALLMYHALYHYAFYESVRKPRLAPTAEQADAARVRHNKYANEHYHRQQAKRRAAAAQGSVRAKLLWAPAWPALVGLIAAAYREELDARNARKKRQRAAKPSHYRAYQRRYRAESRDHLREVAIEWDKRTQYTKRRVAKDIATVSRRYVMNKLLDGTTLRAKHIPPALIEAKRQQLLLRRAIQQKTQT